MPTHPRHHPLVARAIEPGIHGPVPPRPATIPVRVSTAGETTAEEAPSKPRRRLDDQEGSVATEYGLLAVVAATIVSVVLEWATGGGISGLLDGVITRVGELVGL